MVDIGRFDLGAAVAAERPGAQLVAVDNQYVGTIAGSVFLPGGLRRLCGRCRQQRAGQRQ